MTTAVRLIEGAAPRKVTIKIEVDGDAPEMGVWSILEKYRGITDLALKTDIARAMSVYMKRDVSRQMVERWFTEDPMTPRTDYFLALIAVLQSRFRLVEESDPPALDEIKRAPGRPKKAA